MSNYVDTILKIKRENEARKNAELATQNIQNMPASFAGTMPAPIPMPSQAFGIQPPPPPAPKPVQVKSDKTYSLGDIGTDLYHGVRRIPGEAIALGTEMANFPIGSPALAKFASGVRESAYQNFPPAVKAPENLDQLFDMSMSDLAMYALGEAPQFAASFLPFAAGSKLAMTIAPKLVKGASKIPAIARAVKKFGGVEKVAQTISGMASSVGMETSSIYNEGLRAKEENPDLPEVSRLTSFKFGLPAGLAESFEYLKLTGAISPKLSSKAAKTFGQLAMGYGKEIGKDGAIEFGTEALQNLLEDMGAENLTGTPTYDAVVKVLENPDSYVRAGAAGLAGFGGGAGSGIISNRGMLRNPQENTDDFADSPTIPKQTKPSIAPQTDTTPADITPEQAQNVPPTSDIPTVPTEELSGQETSGLMEAIRRAKQRVNEPVNLPRAGQEGLPNYAPYQRTDPRESLDNAIRNIQQKLAASREQKRLEYTESNIPESKPYGLSAAIADIRKKAKEDEFLNVAANLPEEKSRLTGLQDRANKVIETARERKASEIEQRKDTNLEEAVSRAGSLYYAYKTTEDQADKKNLLKRFNQEYTKEERELAISSVDLDISKGIIPDYNKPTQQDMSGSDQVVENRKEEIDTSNIPPKVMNVLTNGGLSRNQKIKQLQKLEIPKKRYEQLLSLELNQTPAKKMSLQDRIRDIRKIEKPLETSVFNRVAKNPDFGQTTFNEPLPSKMTMPEKTSGEIIDKQAADNSQVPTMFQKFEIPKPVSSEVSRENQNQITRDLITNKDYDRLRKRLLMNTNKEWRKIFSDHFGLPAIKTQKELFARIKDWKDGKLSKKLDVTKNAYAVEKNPEGGFNVVSPSGEKLSWHSSEISAQNKIDSLQSVEPIINEKGKTNEKEKSLQSEKKETGRKEGPVEKTVDNGPEISSLSNNDIQKGNGALSGDTGMVRENVSVPVSKPGLAKPTEYTVVEENGLYTIRDRKGKKHGSYSEDIANEMAARLNDPNTAWEDTDKDGANERQRSAPVSKPELAKPTGNTSTDFIVLYNAINKGDVTDIAVYKKAFNDFKSNKEDKLASLMKKKKNQLLGLYGQISPFGAYHVKNEKKAFIANSLFNSMVTNLMIGDEGGIQYDPMEMDGYNKAVQKLVDGYDQETLNRHNEKRSKQAAFTKKSLENPETLKEFERFLKSKKIEDLSADQKKLYDKLREEAGIKKDEDVAEQARKERERRTEAEISKVEGIADLTFEITEGFHTKRNETIYIVTPDQRVDKETFRELNSKAKKLGGNWGRNSRYSDNKDGFNFSTKEAAEAFSKINKEAVDAKEYLKDKKTSDIANASERLSQMADKMEKKANESLEADRQTNTARRASMAASAEASARSDLAFAKTLRRISEGLKDGTVKFLDQIRFKKDLETLNNQLRAAKRNAEKGMAYVDTEKTKYDPVTLEQISKAVYPHPYVSEDMLQRIIDNFKVKPGFKVLAKRLENVFMPYAKAEGSRLNQRLRVEELVQMIDKFKKKYPSSFSREYVFERVLENTKEQERLRRMGINDIHSLRTALRELLQFTETSKKADPLKAAERKLVGKKFEGFDFFPTPKRIAQRMAEELDIKPGMTVLEPSAGKGDLVDAVKEEQPKAEISVIEPLGDLQDILKLKGYDVIDRDFEDFKAEDGKQYDRIIMNPPFSKNRDIKHVRKAYDLLAPGGKLKAIISAHSDFANDKESQEFRKWLDDVGGKREDIGSVFMGKDAFRPTGVNTQLVSITKPVETKTTTPDDTGISGENPYNSRPLHEITKRQLKEDGNQDLFQEQEEAVYVAINNGTELSDDVITEFYQNKNDEIYYKNHKITGNTRTGYSVSGPATGYIVVYQNEPGFLSGKTLNRIRNKIDKRIAEKAQSDKKTPIRDRKVMESAKTLRRITKDYQKGTTVEDELKVSPMKKPARLKPSMKRLSTLKAPSLKGEPIFLSENGKMVFNGKLLLVDNSKDGSIVKNAEKESGYVMGTKSDQGLSSIYENYTELENPITIPTPKKFTDGEADTFLISDGKTSIIGYVNYLGHLGFELLDGHGKIEKPVIIKTENVAFMNKHLGSNQFVGLKQLENSKGKTSVAIFKNKEGSIGASAEVTKVPFMDKIIDLWNKSPLGKRGGRMSAVSFFTGSLDALNTFNNYVSDGMYNVLNSAFQHIGSYVTWLKKAVKEFGSSIRTKAAHIWSDANKIRKAFQDSVNDTLFSTAGRNARRGGGDVSLNDFIRMAKNKIKGEPLKTQEATLGEKEGYRYVGTEQKEAFNAGRKRGEDVTKKVYKKHMAKRGDRIQRAKQHLKDVKAMFKAKREFGQDARAELVRIAKRLPAKLSVKFLKRIAAVDTAMAFGSMINRLDDAIAKWEHKDAMQKYLKVLKDNDINKLRPEFRDAIKELTDDIYNTKPAIQVIQGLMKFIEDDNQDYIDPYTKGVIDALAKGDNDRVLLDAETINILTTAIKTLVEANKRKNKLIFGENLTDVVEVADQAIKAMEKTKKATYDDLGNVSLARWYFDAGLLALEEIAEMFGKVGKRIFFDDINAGEVKTLDIWYKGKDKLAKVLSDLGLEAESRKLEKWANEEVEVNLSAGTKLKIPRSVRMNILANMSDPTTRDEIIKGGIKVERLGETFKFTEDDLDNISSDATESEHKIVDAMKEYLNNDLKKEINSVWVQLAGYEKALSEKYWPRKRETNPKGFNAGYRQWASSALEHMGIFKERTTSDKAVIIGDIFSTYQNHLKQASTFAGTAIPLRNVEMALGVGGMEKAIEKHLGTKMVKRIKAHMEAIGDLGNAPVGEVNRLAQGLLQKVSVGFLGFNPRSAIKQAGGLFTAATEISPTLLISNSNKAFDKGITERMMKYSSQLRNRYDGAGAKMVNPTFEDRDTIMRVKGTKGKIERATKAAMKMLEEGDKAVTQVIWGAVEEKFAADKAKMSEDAFYNKVARETEMIVMRTQNVTSKLGMSGLAIESRKNAFLKAAVAFQSQGNAIYNIVRRAIRKYRRGGIELPELLSALTMALMGNAMWSVFISQVASIKWLKGNREALTKSDVAVNLLRENLGNIYGGSMVSPFVRTVARSYQGKKVWSGNKMESVTQSVINNVLAGAAQIATAPLKEDKLKALQKGTLKMAGGVLPMAGLPLIPLKEVQYLLQSKKD